MLRPPRVFGHQLLVGRPRMLNCRVINRTIDIFVLSCYRFISLQAFYLSGVTVLVQYSTLLRGLLYVILLYDGYDEIRCIRKYMWTKWNAKRFAVKFPKSSGSHNNFISVQCADREARTNAALCASGELPIGIADPRRQQIIPYYNHRYDRGQIRQLPTIYIQ